MASLAANTVSRPATGGFGTLPFMASLIVVAALVFGLGRWIDNSYGFFLGYVVVQYIVLGTALDSLRPGGVVAYVTCSPHLAETRDVVLAVAQARDDVTILDAPAVLAEVPRLRQADSGDGSRFAQFWPHRHGTDAIFLALLRRNDSGTAEGAG